MSDKISLKVVSDDNLIYEDNQEFSRELLDIIFFSEHEAIDVIKDEFVLSRKRLRVNFSKSFASMLKFCDGADITFENPVYEFTSHLTKQDCQDIVDGKIFKKDGVRITKHSYIINFTVNRNDENNR